MQSLLLAGLALDEVVEGSTRCIDFRRGLRPDHLEFGFDGMEFLVDPSAGSVRVGEESTPIAGVFGPLGELGGFGVEFALAGLEFADVGFDVVVHAVAEPITVAHGLF